MLIVPYCGITYYIRALSAQTVNRKNTPCECCASFFIKLTTLNDEMIDKDLLLNLNLYQVTYGLEFLIVLTAVCRR